MKPDFLAPGEDILAAVAPEGNHGRSFDMLSGTSMSSPHVAGFGALLTQAHPDWSPAAMRSALATTAAPLAGTATSAIFNAGSGQVNRSEKISLTIAAVVTGVLPNGNMMIQGTQEVRTNTDVRQLTVAGIVRPEDISSANTIRHTQIAEARISYGGCGDISRVQKTPSGQSLVERFSPF